MHDNFEHGKNNEEKLDLKTRQALKLLRLSHNTKYYRPQFKHEDRWQNMAQEKPAFKNLRHRNGNPSNVACQSAEKYNINNWKMIYLCVWNYSLKQSKTTRIRDSQGQRLTHTKPKHVLTLRQIRQTQSIAQLQLVSNALCRTHTEIRPELKMHIRSHMYSKVKGVKTLVT